MSELSQKEKDFLKEVEAVKKAAAPSEKDIKEAEEYAKKKAAKKTEKESKKKD